MSKKVPDYGVHNFNDSHRNQFGSGGTEGSLSFQPKGQDDCRLEVTKFDSSNYQQSREDYCMPPPADQSLTVLSEYLQIPGLSMEHCLYVGNISVRADKQEIADWLSHLGPLQLFEFTVKDKQFRFQGGVAIFSLHTNVTSITPSRPFVIAKRKVKLMELSARKNASTLLAVLLKKTGLSPTQTQFNLNTKNQYDFSCGAEKKHSAHYSQAPSLQDHFEPIASVVDTYSTTEGHINGPTNKSTRNHRISSESSGAVSTTFVAEHLQRFFEPQDLPGADVPGKRITSASSSERCRFLALDNTLGSTLRSGSLTLSRCSIPFALINSVGQNHQKENVRFNLLAICETGVSVKPTLKPLRSAE